MTGFWNVLGRLQKKLIISIPVAMGLGLVFGYFFEAGFLKDWIVPFTFLMVYPMMVTLKVKELLKKSDTKLQITAQLINFAIIPFLGLGIGLLFFRDNPMVVLGLLLASLLPTSGMTISWTGFSKGNVPAAVKMTVIGLILGSILTPVYIKFLMGTQVDVSLTQIFTQILFIVFLPLAAGVLTQFALVKRSGQEKFDKEIKPKFPVVSTIGVAGNRIYIHGAEIQKYHRESGDTAVLSDAARGAVCCKLFDEYRDWETVFCKEGRDRTGLRHSDAKPVHSPGHCDGRV